MNVTANNISNGGALSAGIINFAAAPLSAAPISTLISTGDLTTQGDALLTISNDTGGTIGSDAVINVTAANISTGGALNAAIINSSGGSGGNIVGSANINFNLTGDLTLQATRAFHLKSAHRTIGGIPDQRDRGQSTVDAQPTLLRILCWLRSITRAAASSGTRTSTSI